MKLKQTILKRILPAAVLLLALILLMLHINRSAVFDTGSTEGVTAVRAQITRIVSGEITRNADGVYAGTQTVRAKLLSGEQKGREVEASNTANAFEAVECAVGTRVVLAISHAGDQESIFVNGYDRTYVFVALFGLFALAMLLIAGLKGLKALVGLAFTFVTLIGVFIPLICQGYSPYPVAVLWGVVTTVVTLALISGMNTKTAAAALSTAAGVTVSGLIASLFGALAHISGYNLLYAEELYLLNTGVRIRIGGLLFAGILISALGAVMDVCMSISSTVHELHAQNPTLSAKALFTSGMHVGRDMMGTMANTLILAFAGSSLTMLILVYAYKADPDLILSMNDLAIEIIQGLSGSLGIFLSVPIVSATAAALVKLPERFRRAK